MTVTRRSIIMGAAATGILWSSEPAAAEAPESLTAPAYAAIRVVRAVAGEPAQPQIVVPAGYSLVPGPQYQVASRAEYTSFIQGPIDRDGVLVIVRWPGQPIRAVVAGEARLRMIYRTGDPSTVAVKLPVWRASPVADSPTIQVWSQLSNVDTGQLWLVAHNDPDRAVGYWAGVTWPAGPVRAVISNIAACASILRETGLVDAARSRGHFFALEGFETNNMLHLDNPPHWHMSYYSGGTTSSPATIPHYWVDAAGRTFYNGQDTTGQPRAKYYANDPAPIYDTAGNLIVTTTIRTDGGLDVTPPGGPVYSITATDFTGPLRILRDGLPWRTITTDDQVRDGILRIDDGATRSEYRYDPLTGVAQPPIPY